ncbi:hypothetical protein B0H10DRAFT_2224860 [Mycena sp. CBHHK59/15]|nr:hypothetical protein B0H10DRAFT_2224860 [Mycena sp. CBHHK59/15]
MSFCAMDLAAVAPRSSEFAIHSVEDVPVIAPVARILLALSLRESQLSYSVLCPNHVFAA